MPTQAQQLDALIARLEPDLRDAFRQAMQDWRDGVNQPALISALERGDIDAAIRALNIEPAVFNAYTTTKVLSFAELGMLMTSFIRIPGAEGAPVQIRFDMSNPRAESWIREQAAMRVVGYTQEQTETARKVIIEGYSQGQGPQTIATDIAGRINRVTGRREGGILGLSDPQAGYVQSMRQRLESGDPDEMRRIFGMTRRDKRYDRTIRRAIRDGTPIPQATIDKMLGRYSDRLLALRAETVARTETATAVMGARAESYAQALEKAGLPDNAVTKTWIHSGLIEHARAQHIVMSGESVVGLNTPFILPDGTAMQHSHDPAGGAVNVINCRCDTRYEIAFGRGVT